MIEAEGWSDLSRQVFDEPVVQRLTFKLALLIISVCGFGFDSFSWSEPPKDENREMGVQESLRVFTETIMISTMAPKWFWKLPIALYV